ncbi:MAG TPA: Fic/DOC family N-terminal domain-containing protein [Opitutus sp.]|nr:Fic/DOC family N-terminal domain-containing protein [Opitutus sp.]
MQPCVPEPLPITNLDWHSLIPLIGRANRELARFDGLLHGIRNPAVLLSPITTQEAVLSSRIEGTAATLSDVLQFEAGELFPDEEEKRNDIVEISNYRRSLRRAEEALRDRPFNLNLMLKLHEVLLDSVRGRDKLPGRFRINQNWIGIQGATLAEASFVPPSPLDLPRLLTEWENYYHADERDPLVQLAIIHAQFEILHPFNDGNGRIGRILIPLFLFEKKILSQPMFYLSAYLEARRSEYIGRLRELGQPGSWNRWLAFFLEGVATQAAANAQTARAILALYERLKHQVIDLTHSQFAVPLLDHLFARPATSASDLERQEDMPTLAMVSTLLRQLAQAGVLKIARQGQGRRATIYVLHHLVNLCEGREVF